VASKHALELFLPRRMAFVFELNDGVSACCRIEEMEGGLKCVVCIAAADMPTTLMRSRADCPPPQELVTARVGDTVLQKVRTVMAFYQRGHHAQRKRKELADDPAAPPSAAPVDAPVPVAAAAAAAAAFMRPEPLPPRPAVAVPSAPAAVAAQSECVGSDGSRAAAGAHIVPATVIFSLMSAARMFAACPPGPRRCVMM
jgi:hypothetical protein